MAAVAAPFDTIGYAPTRRTETELLQRKRLSVVAGFPWPITDEDLVLNNALTGVMSTYEARGDVEESYIREAAAKLIVEAYNQGIRDPEVLAHYALKALRGGQSGLARSGG